MLFFRKINLKNKQVYLKNKSSKKMKHETKCELRYLALRLILHIQGVSVFHVHIFTTNGGMKTTLYGNFIMCKFTFGKKLQHFEFICEKPIFAVNFLFFAKIS